MQFQRLIGATTTLAALTLLSGDFHANAQQTAPSISGVDSFGRLNRFAPGQLIMIRGKGFADGNHASWQLPLPKLVGTSKVTVGGVDAPMVVTTPSFILAQIPFEVKPDLSHLQAITVTHGTASSNQYQVSVVEHSAAIMTEDWAYGGRVQIYNSEGGSLTKIAPGEKVVVYATGLGATKPPTETGSLGNALPGDILLQTAPVLTIGGAPAKVTSARMLPEWPGVYEVLAELTDYAQDNSVQLGMTASNNIDQRKLWLDIADSRAKLNCGDCGHIYDPYYTGPATVTALPLPSVGEASFTIEPTETKEPFYVLARTGLSATLVIRFDPEKRTYEATVTSPTAAARAGDFSKFYNGTLDLRTKTAFPGGIIPMSRMDPFIVMGMNLIPLPNAEVNESMAQGLVKTTGSYDPAAPFAVSPTSHAELSHFSAFLTASPSSLTGFKGFYDWVTIWVDGRQAYAGQAVYYPFLP